MESEVLAMGWTAIFSPISSIAFGQNSMTFWSVTFALWIELLCAFPTAQGVDTQGFHPFLSLCASIK
jgi:hypothetical protein